MGLQETASAERVHIAFFGMRNAGKSALVNAVTAQDMSVVSDVPGTTTDPVKKSMELLPLGPVLIIDTPGLDDEGPLGQERVRRARRILFQADLAVLVVSAEEGLKEADRGLISLFQTKGLPWVLVYTKTDLASPPPVPEGVLPASVFPVSALKGEGIEALKEGLGAISRASEKKAPICRDLFSPGETVLLVTPQDGSAPKGRLILPQQLTLREILDHHGIPLLTQPEEYERALRSLKKPPALVITDSQVFGRIEKATERDIPLTSFSILMARYKGILKDLIAGAKELKKLRDKDPVLISEGCTHHRQCEDIGTVKLPRWIREYSGANPSFSFSSGNGFPEDPKEYRLILHCGGCMLTEREMGYRLSLSKEAGVPMTNYGVAIAEIHGILDRSIEMLDLS